MSLKSIMMMGNDVEESIVEERTEEDLEINSQEKGSFSTER